MFHCNPILCGYEINKWRKTRVLHSNWKIHLLHFFFSFITYLCLIILIYKIQFNLEINWQEKDQSNLNKYVHEFVIEPHRFCIKNNENLHSNYSTVELYPWHEPTSRFFYNQLHLLDNLFVFNSMPQNINNTDSMYIYNLFGQWWKVPFQFLDELFGNFITLS